MVSVISGVAWVVSELEANINVRCTRVLRDKVDEAARAMGVSRTEWVLDAIEAKYRAVHDRPPVVVGVTRRRMTVAGRTPPALCVHPLALRTSIGPDGTARCMGCDSSIGVST